jgi:iron complex transport system permease protein
VAVAGTVAFIGLLAPHLARLLVGADHRRLLPLSALLGGLLLLLADTLGRGLLSPLEVPAGIMTALLGAPYFLYLLSRYRGG